MSTITAAHGPAASEPALPAALDRRFEAAILDWEEAAVADRHADGSWLRSVVEELCGLGFDLAVVTDFDVDDVADQLGARPSGPGRLVFCADGGSAVFEAGAHGLDLLHRRQESHVEIGHTSRLTSARWILADLWARGIAPGSVLLASHQFDVADDVFRQGAVTLDGGTDFVRLVLRDQIQRRLNGDVPDIDPAADWSFTIGGFDPRLERVHESLLTLADGSLGTRGSPLVGDGATTPGVFLMGVYDGTGPATELARLPLWSRLADGGALGPSRRTIDLRTGVLYEEGALRSIRFSSLARPRTVAMRVRADDALLPPTGTRTERGAINAAFHDNRRDGGFERLGAYDADPKTAEAALVAAEEAGFERLLREQREAWARRWQEADVVVDGDPELQRAIRFALFHVMASVGEGGEAAVGARGLSGSAYRGHVFWDSDVFVLPFLAASHPAAARAMLEYRIRRLPAARAEARRLGRAGARFPWESAGEGVDVTPNAMQLPTGDLRPVRTGQLEEHIVADVAWAAACYIDWTGDAAFAAGAGRELLIETARYWASRVRRDDDGRAHIEGVIGPDEYHELIDDNAFTNVMARWNLRRASAIEGGVANAERAAWHAVADALVDGYDPQTKLYEQHAGFFDLEPIVIAEISPRRPIAADLLLGVERIRQTQVVKQPDVLMLHHLVPDEVAAESLHANLDFYEPRTAHGSSLSPAIYAALLARARRFGPALAWLNIAARIDLDDLTGSTAGGLHLATMGGLWQALVFGFAGVRAGEDCLLIDPRLPPQWDALQVGLRYRGTPVRLYVAPGTVKIDTDVLELRRVDEHWEVVRR